MRNSSTATSQEEQKTLGGIPDELLLGIFMRLTAKELVAASQVCIQWRRVVNDKTLWVQHIHSLDQRIRNALNENRLPDELWYFRIGRAEMEGIEIPAVLPDAELEERRDQIYRLFRRDATASNHTTGQDLYRQLIAIDNATSSRGSNSRVGSFFHIPQSISQTFINLPNDYLSIFYNNPKMWLMSVAMLFYRSITCFTGVCELGIRTTFALALLGFVVLPLVMLTIDGIAKHIINSNLGHREMNLRMARQKYIGVAQQLQDAITEDEAELEPGEVSNHLHPHSP